MNPIKGKDNDGDQGLNIDQVPVFAEPYDTLIVAENGLKNPEPKVHNLDPRANIKAWVDRKHFIHNPGHATAVYPGFRIFSDETFFIEAEKGLNHVLGNFYRLNLQLQ